MVFHTTRRDFVASSVAAAVAAALPKPLAGVGGHHARRRAPVVIASGNGNEYRNGGTETCVQKSFTMMTQGADVLGAIVAGVNIVGLDTLE